MALCFLIGVEKPHIAFAHQLPERAELLLRYRSSRRPNTQRGTIFILSNASRSGCRCMGRAAYHPHGASRGMGVLLRSLKRSTAGNLKLLITTGRRWDECIRELYAFRSRTWKQAFNAQSSTSKDNPLQRYRLVSQKGVFLYWLLHRTLVLNHNVRWDWQSRDYTLVDEAGTRKSRLYHDFGRERLE